jgi:hypothetical protein
LLNCQGNCMEAATQPPCAHQANPRLHKPLT